MITLLVNVLILPFIDYGMKQSFVTVAEDAVSITQ